MMMAKSRPVTAGTKYRSVAVGGCGVGSGVEGAMSPAVKYVEAVELP